LKRKREDDLAESIKRSEAEAVERKREHAVCEMATIMVNILKKEGMPPIVYQLEDVLPKPRAKELFSLKDKDLQVSGSVSEWIGQQCQCHGYLLS
jgi:hypothetical protein